GFCTRLPGSNQARRVRIGTPVLRAAGVFLSGARKEQAALFCPNVPALFLLQLERVSGLLLLGLTAAQAEQGREGQRAFIKRAAIDRVPPVRWSCRLCHTCFLRDCVGGGAPSLTGALPRSNKNGGRDGVRISRSSRQPCEKSDASPSH